MQTHVEYLTPPTIAKRLGVSVEKIIGWILAGELRGANVATKLGGRPRYRVSESDLAEFLERRSAAVQPAPRRRLPKSSGRRFYT